MSTYGYDAAGRLSSITDQSGITVVTNVYGTDGRVISQTDGRGNTSTFDWNPDTQTSTFTDARGNAWRDVYLDGALVERIDPLGNATFFGYDAGASLASTTDADGNITTYAYDPAGNLLSKTDPMGAQTTYTYDSKNDVTSVTDPLGNVTTFGYDAAGNLTSMTRPGGIQTGYGRDPVGTGLLTSVTDPNGAVTTYGYDSAGNLGSVTDPLGNTTTMAYDPSGRMTSQVSPRGNVSGANAANFTAEYAYDGADRVLTQTDPLNDVTAFVYDAVGNLATVTDANGNQTAYTYDGNNNLTSVQAPDGATTSYAYDETNNLVSRTDDNGNTWTYGYDGANRITSVSSPMGKTWGFAYDPAGNLLTKTLPSSDAIAYGYDGDNRLVSVDYSATATPDVGLAYDAAGNRTEMTDGAGTLGYTYDELNRLTAITRGSDTFSYTYDDAGNLTSRTYPDQTQIDYGYDASNELTSVTTGGSTTSYTYDPDGNLATATLPANTVTYTWDRADRLTKVSNKKGTSTISVFNPTLDPAGNPTQVVTKTETITYAYDQNRLTQVCYLPGCSGSGLAGISYAYDGVGNRTSESRYGSSPTTTYAAYNSDDELCWTASSSGTCSSPPTGATTYSYDANGNQTAAGSRTFAYDLENRLVSTTASGSTESYTYDGDGNRLTLSEDGTLETSYLWDSNAPLAQLAIERDGSGTLLRRYVYGRALLSMTEGGSAYYFLADDLGSIANVTSSSGNAVWTYTYEPFGAIRLASGGQGAPSNPMRFTAQLLDATTGLYDLRARIYDPTSGRFLQRDSIIGSVLSPLVAQYVYGSNRPTVMVDPSGLAVESAGGVLGWLCGGVTCDSVASEMWRNPVNSYLTGRGSVPDWIEGVGWGLMIVGGGFLACTAAGIATCAAAGQLTGHSALRMLQRGVSLSSVVETLQQGEAFSYNYRGYAQVGYYDFASRIFVATRNGVITTVMTNVRPGYIRALQGG